MDFDKAMDELLLDGEYMYSMETATGDFTDERMLLAIDTRTMTSRPADSAADALAGLLHLLTALTNVIESKYEVVRALAELVEQGEIEEIFDEATGEYRYKTVVEDK